MLNKFAVFFFSVKRKLCSGFEKARGLSAMARGCQASQFLSMPHHKVKVKLGSILT